MLFKISLSRVMKIGVEVTNKNNSSSNYCITIWGELLGRFIISMYCIMLILKIDQTGLIYDYCHYFAYLSGIIYWILYRWLCRKRTVGRQRLQLSVSCFWLYCVVACIYSKQICKEYFFAVFIFFILISCDIHILRLSIYYTVVRNGGYAHSWVM